MIYIATKPHVWNYGCMTRSPFVVSLVNTKGGVGKTTTAIFLGCALARQGSVIVLDADPQGSAGMWADDADEAGDPLPFPVREANLRTLGRVDKETTDFVVVDTPPGNPALINAALDAADLVIIPTEAGQMDLARTRLTAASATGVRRAVLLTKTDHTRQSRRAADQLATDESLVVLDTRIRRLVSYRDAVGTNPVELGEFTDLAHELLELIA